MPKKAAPKKTTHRTKRRTKSRLELGSLGIKFSGRWLLAELAVLVLVAVSAAGYIYMKPMKPAKVTKVSVQLAWLDQAQFAGMYVANDKGYYKDAGLEVELAGAVVALYATA